jgi:hypothetical protein
MILILNYCLRNWTKSFQWQTDVRVLRICVGYVWTCIYIYIYTHTYIHTYTHTHTHTHTHTWESPPTYTCKQKNVVLQTSIALKKWHNALVHHKEPRSDQRICERRMHIMADRRMCGPEENVDLIPCVADDKKCEPSQPHACACLCTYCIKVHLPFRAGRAAMTNDQYFLSTLLSVRLIAPFPFFSFSFLSN